MCVYVHVYIYLYLQMHMYLCMCLHMHVSLAFSIMSSRMPIYYTVYRVEDTTSHRRALHTTSGHQHKPQAREWGSMAGCSLVAVYGSVVGMIFIIDSSSGCKPMAGCSLVAGSLRNVTVALNPPCGTSQRQSSLFCVLTRAGP